MASVDDRTSSAAVILAAGYGSRLAEITNGRPKSLLEINERSLIERHLCHLHALEVTDVAVVVGHESEVIREHLKPFHSTLNLTFVENAAYAEGGNAYSMFLGLQQVQGSTFVFDADLIYTREILERFVQNPGENLMLVGLGSVEDVESVKILVDADNRVMKAVSKRHPTTGELERYSFAGEAMGVLKFSNEGRRRILELCQGLFAREDNMALDWEPVVNLFFESGEMYVHHDSSDQWHEIDTPEDYAEAVRKFAAT